MALDLTYHGPTDQQIADLEAGTATLASMADVYMASPEFEQVVFDWYRAQFPPTDRTRLVGSVDVEEPARIARHIVLADLDYRLLLTGDFTVAPTGDPIPGTNGPAAGIISTQHYMSAFAGSFRRNWAGHFLKEWTPIVLEAVTLPPDSADEDLSPANTMTNPSCAGCHASPIYGIDHLAPFSFCYADDGTYQAGCTPTASKFLGGDGNTLPELGRIVTDSNEFMATTVNFYFQKLFGRSMAYDERLFYVQMVTEFRSNDYKAKSLIKSLVTSPHYCAR
jgi:hypothetical protein